jgi:hypothetical protein
MLLRSMTSQPVQDSAGNVLLWNGDVFDGDVLQGDNSSQRSDTDLLSERLMATDDDDIAKVQLSFTSKPEAGFVRRDCQMVYFQTKNPDLGKFWIALH